MKLQSLLVRLSKIDGWFMTPDGQIRTLVNNQRMCPLTAVANAKLGTKFTLVQPGDAALALKPERWTAGEVARAADNECDSDRERRIRRDLIKYCRLENAA